MTAADEECPEGEARGRLVGGRPVRPAPALGTEGAAVSAVAESGARLGGGGEGLQGVPPPQKGTAAGSVTMYIGLSDSLLRLTRPATIILRFGFHSHCG